MDLRILTQNSSQEADDEVSRINSFHAHEPLSPQSGAESLFLAGLETSSVSANVLADELKRQYRPHSARSSSMYSTFTDDFATALESTDDLDSFIDKEVSLETIESSDFDFYPESTNVSMSTIKPSSALPATPKVIKKAVQETKAEEKIDVASHVYEGVKGAWGWGKGIVVISPFLGIAEGIANKVVGVVGTDLEHIDGNLKPHISNFDKGVLNPAIDAVVGVVLGVAGKTEDIVKPIICTILTPFGLIEMEKKDDTPELTN